MISGRNFFDQPIVNDIKTFDNIRKIPTGQEDNYAVGCLLDYPYFKKYIKLIAIDLSKQQNQMLIQKQYNKIILPKIQIEWKTQQCFFIIDEVKETVLDFLKVAVKVL